MVGFLAGVVHEARMRVAHDARSERLAELRPRALETAPPPVFAGALSRAEVAVIAEVKRASPSRGALAAIGDPAGLARAYADGGASAISVLTEPRHFRGDMADLIAVAAEVDVPVLRKDFIIDPYQIFQARAAGAAAVLLIVAALTRDELAALLTVAAEAGLDALVEIHDKTELASAVSAHALAGGGQPGEAIRLVLGINARDLVTLTVDPGVFGRLRRAVPEGALVVAESGVAGPDDVRARGREGAHAVLVGEHVASADDPSDAVQALVTAGREAASATLPETSRGT